MNYDDQTRDRSAVSRAQPASVSSAERRRLVVFRIGAPWIGGARSQAKWTGTANSASTVFELL
jgi:hypothetical protein